ncbi:MFS transporter [soil metagenome]
MNSTERKIVLALASILSFRMLGLFMILPVFALYADTLHGVTPTLLGLAMGIYGLTQALLQLPFGTLSDFFGRKPVIVFGLVIFAIGSAIAAMSDSITGVIIGRALQGAGAIGSVIMALVADLTKEQHRPMAMAFLGMSIGISFISAMALGPLLNSWISVAGIFWVTAGLALLGILVLVSCVPDPSDLQTNTPHDREETKTAAQPISKALQQLYLLFQNRTLLQLNFGIFTLHIILTAIFVVIPPLLKNTVNLPGNQQWYLFLPVIIISFLIALPFLVIAEKKRQMKIIYLGAIMVLGISQLLLWQYHNSLFPVAINLLLFFAAFTLLEACLPSLVAKFAPATSRGSAMGMFSCSQFLGIFVGGTVAGWLSSYGGSHNVFLMCGIMACIWFGAVIVNNIQIPYTKERVRNNFPP